ncbi:50S ribosomal protein L5 [Planctomicrobium sp. SH664]|uniref:50S ribosomal protein L5 n=1 Tax=Planctomicrobium sp. SH664 TaxID=3448125 RepID=UPI003F5B42F9
MSRFLEKYRTEIAPKLAKELGRTNPHSLPALQKIVVSMGVGKAIGDQKILDEAMEHLGQITGQKPSVRQSRKSIAQFKLREGMRVGGCVTLRQGRMYEFLDRLITLVLPRVRDFRGVNPKAFDGRGNYSLGLNEQVVFPEINADKVKNIQGMNIAIVTSAKTDDEARLLLKEFGMPFREPGSKK